MVESQISRNRVKEENVFKEYLFLFLFFSFLFFLLWSGSGTSREVVLALNSRADVTSLLVIVSTFFLVSPFVLTDLVHRKPEYLSLSTGSKFATPKSFQFWRDRFPLATLLFIIFLFF